MQRHVWPGIWGGSERRIVLTTLLCFSLAGLLTGFALGGFVSRAAGRYPGGPAATSALSIAGHSPTPTGSRQVASVVLGLPVVRAGDYTGQERADGTTPYRLSASIVTKTGATPISATDVTCRLWLTDDMAATSAALGSKNYALLRDLSAFASPFPHEVAHALLFAPASPQTQPCVPQGKTSWTYTLAPTLPHGGYFLVVLADWQGVHYNWSMVAIGASRAGTR